MSRIDAIKICPECSYHEIAIYSGPSKLSWTARLEDIADRKACNVMPDDCPHFKRAEIQWAPPG